MRFGALQETRALRPPQMVHPKKLDLAPPASVVTAGESLRIKVLGPNPGTEIPGSVIRG